MDTIFRIAVLVFAAILCLLLLAAGAVVVAIILTPIVAIFWAFFQAVAG